MRQFPEDESDLKDLESLHAEKWQIDLLKLNPEYVYWGCFEDYMTDKDSQWGSPIITKKWEDHADWKLDSYNELVNFYFEVYRKNHKCPECSGQGYNNATKKISDSFYDFNNTGERWCDNITIDEVEKLVEEGRLSDFMPDDKWYRKEKEGWFVLEKSTDKKGWVKSEKPMMPNVDEVNEANSRHSARKGFASHDGINRMYLIEQRAKRLGVYGLCEKCNGEGFVYDEPNARVALQLWYLHPRKGSSRGVYIENIEQKDLANIFAYLKEARDRNAERFSKI